MLLRARITEDMKTAMRAKDAPRLQRTASRLAEIDVAAALAEHAHRCDYARPEVDTSLTLDDLVPDLRELFHLDRPAPIVLSGLLDIPSPELEDAGIQQVYPITELDIEIRLEWDAPDATVQITRFRFGDGKDAAQKPLCVKI